jgi:nickel transport protein
VKRLLPGPLVMAAIAMLQSTLAPAPAPAHGLEHTVTADNAVVVTLTHDDGDPFSFEPYQVVPPGQDKPSQQGLTDRLGRVAFLPDRTGDWKVRVMAEDGHGADLTVPVGTGLLPVGSPAVKSSRFTNVVTGVSILFGLFGIAALMAARRAAASKTPAGR